MKRSTILLAGALLCLGTTASQAQHGRPQGGAGRPSAPGKSAAPERPTTPSTSRSSKAETGGPTSTEHRKTTDELLAQNTKLSSKLQTLLGRDPRGACQGFSNLGQCVATARVSDNLGISFDALKARTTGPDPKSLGEAIHELNPNIDAKAEVRKARKQADADLRSK